MFYTREPNTGNTFSAYFLKHNQTNQNVFLFVKYFQRSKIILYVAKHSLNYGLYYKWFAFWWFCKKVQVLVTVQLFLTKNKGKILWWGGMALSFLVSLTVSVWWCLSDVYTCHWMRLFGGSHVGPTLFLLENLHVLKERRP